MNRLIRRMNTRKAKRIAELSGISATIILLFILLAPLYSFMTKVVYAYMCLVALLKLWNVGTQDWDTLAIA